MIQLWGRKNAYNVQKVLWLLAELEQPFQHHDVGSQPGDLETPEFLKLNPLARIPVLTHGDRIIRESNSILRYLGSHFSAFQLLPEDAYSRSQIECWMDWELASWQPDFIDLFWRYYRTPEDSHNAELIRHSQQGCERHIKILDQRLQHHPYLSGNHFSLADICCASGLFRYFEMGLPVNKPDNLSAWYQRLCTRPAYQQTIMTSFSELKGRENF